MPHDKISNDKVSTAKNAAGYGKKDAAHWSGSLIASLRRAGSLIVAAGKRFSTKIHLSLRIWQERAAPGLPPYLRYNASFPLILEKLILDTFAPARNL